MIQELRKIVSWDDRYLRKVERGDKRPQRGVLIRLLTQVFEVRDSRVDSILVLYGYSQTSLAENIAWRLKLEWLPPVLKKGSVNKLRINLSTRDEGLVVDVLGGALGAFLEACPDPKNAPEFNFKKDLIEVTLNDRTERFDGILTTLGRAFEELPHQGGKQEKGAGPTPSRKPAAQVQRSGDRHQQVDGDGVGDPS